jgi:hypothetical protein
VHKWNTPFSIHLSGFINPILFVCVLLSSVNIKVEIPGMIAIHDNLWCKQVRGGHTESPQTLIKRCDRWVDCFLSLFWTRISLQSGLSTYICSADPCVAPVLHTLMSVNPDLFEWKMAKHSLTVYIARKRFLCQEQNHFNFERFRCLTLTMKDRRLLAVNCRASAVALWYELNSAGKGVTVRKMKSEGFWQWCVITFSIV